MERTAEAVWRNCLNYVQDNISPQAYKTWFLPIRPVKLQSKVITLQVPSKFVYEWLEAHYIKLLKSAITKELGPDARLVYSIVMDQDTAHLEVNKVDIPSSNRGPIENPQVSLPTRLLVFIVARPAACLAAHAADLSPPHLCTCAARHARRARRASGG